MQVPENAFGIRRCRGMLLVLSPRVQWHLVFSLEHINCLFSGDPDKSRLSPKGFDAGTV